MNILSELSTGRIVALPKPLLIGLAALAGTTAIGGTWFASRGSPIAVAIVAAGLVFVFLLFLLFRALVKWSAKRKASPMAAGLAGNAAAAPQGVSEPARRARLDDLRRNFEQGVEKFRAAGKNLYSVPWYVLVGEPGSGKTEAIRHCNVGFPPGLQDQLQGAGGTLNMNWWFTNSAIILDTAGRLMFEEVAPGSTNEWNEFLKLLKQNRPNSPINGLLLVIPVDTLIKDSADSIEKKATKIAQQFDQIQRILGVRFPVFVIITKCDLLNGFREFFDDLNDPQLQHQIMGWSNPAPLDERFDPAKVTAHLESVKQRLIVRRQNLLLDPVNTEDPNGRRADQVDALYALPDALLNIGPRLRRYLEMIFVAGEWSPKPLFLRGIYFTSSMTEGAALDDELAKALGVPVDSLPGGAIFRKDRAYFLRDLFLEKVFREKGLVTRATNADKQQRTRRMLVMGFGFFAVLFLFGITVWAYYGLNKSLGSERDLWKSLSDIKAYDAIAIINKDSGTYHGDADLTVAGSRTTLTDFFSNNLDRVSKDLDIPLVFRPMKFISGEVNVQRRTAYRDLFEVTVLQPAYDRAREGIRAQLADKNGVPKSLTSDNVNAIYAGTAELMKLEYARALGKPPEVTSPWVKLDPLFALALAKDDPKAPNPDWTAYTLKDDSHKKSDSEKLQAVVDWLYTPAAQGEKSWPPAALGPGVAKNTGVIENSVKALTVYWEGQAADNSDALKNINAVIAALDQFKAAEANLLRLQQSPVDKFSSYVEFRKQWSAEYAKLRSAGDTASKAWADAKKDAPESATLVSLYTAQKDKVISDATKQYDVLLRLTPDSAAGSGPNSSYDSLHGVIRATLQSSQDKLKNWKGAAKTVIDHLGDLDTSYLAVLKDTDDKSRRRFEVQAHLYAMANQTIVRDGDPVSLAPVASLADAFAKADKDGTDVTDVARRLAIQANAANAADPLLLAISLTQFTVDASTRARKYLLADSVLTNYPADAAGWTAAIKKLAKDAPREGLTRPQLPMVTFPAGLEKIFNDQFSPDAAGVVMDRLGTITTLTSDKDAAVKILDAASLKTRADASHKSFDLYRDAYITYWRDTVKEEIAFNYTDFKEFSAQLGDATEANIYEKLKAYGDAMASALNRVNAADDANAVKAAISQVSREECKVALTSWANFPPDAVAVRRAILGQFASDFKEGYTVPSAKNNTGFAAWYWNNLPVAALKALVAEGQKQIKDGIAELAKYERFPLAPMTDNAKNDLTMADILAARTALEKIRGAASSASAPATAGGGAGAVSLGARRISDGGAINSKDIDAQLDLLRGTNLLRDKQDYFNKLDKLLAALPADNKPFTAVITPNKEKLRDAPDTIANFFGYMPVTQGGKSLKEVSIIGASVEPVNIEFPGTGDLLFTFKQTPSSTPILPQTFSGPWALLRFLKSPNVDANSVNRDATGKIWTLAYYVNVPDAPEPKRRALWLTLEFKQPVPDVKDWPVPPGK